MASLYLFYTLHVIINGILLRSYAAVLSPCSTLLREVTLRFGSENESFLNFHFALLSPCSTLLREVTLRFGSENESFLNFHFALLSPCSNFAPKYIGISK